MTGNEKKIGGIFVLMLYKQFEIYLDKEAIAK